MLTRVLRCSFSQIPTSLTKKSFRTWTVSYYPIVALKLTDIGEGIREVTVKQSFVEVNQQLNQFDNVCEVESDKASVTITSRFDGQVKAVHFREGDVILVGSTLCDIDVLENDDSCSPCGDHVIDKLTVGDEVKIDEPPAEFLPTGKKELTPAVRRIAREYNLDVNKIPGTGKGGRILKEDVLNHINKQSVQSLQSSQSTSGHEHNEDVQPLSGYLKTMYKTMTESNSIPTACLSDEIDVTDIEQKRKSMMSNVDPSNRITLLSFIVKAVSLTLKKHPIMNSSLEDNFIRYKHYHNISIAIQTPFGLIVPNVKNVQNLTIKQIAAEIKRLQLAGNEGIIKLEDTRGGTFSVSNIGRVGGTVAKPLILSPEVGIIGIGRIQPLPRYDCDEKLSKRLIITTSWSADHRIIDGVTIANCSNSLKEYLENPISMLLDM